MTTLKYANKLLDVAKLTLSNRGKSYGYPKRILEDIAKRWSLTLGIDVNSVQVVLCLIELKLARLNIDSKHYDSIVDVAGYIALLEEINNS